MRRSFQKYVCLCSSSAITICDLIMRQLMSTKDRDVWREEHGRSYNSKLIVHDHYKVYTGTRYAPVTQMWRQLSSCIFDQPRIHVYFTHVYLFMWVRTHYASVLWHHRSYGIIEHFMGSMRQIRPKDRNTAAVRSYTFSVAKYSSLSVYTRYLVGRLVVDTVWR